MFSSTSSNNNFMRTRFGSKGCSLIFEGDWCAVVLYEAQNVQKLNEEENTYGLSFDDHYSYITLLFVVLFFFFNLCISTCWYEQRRALCCIVYQRHHSLFTSMTFTSWLEAKEIIWAWRLYHTSCIHARIFLNLASSNRQICFFLPLKITREYPF